MIGKTIDIAVTSVLQTTAGKMIFGKWDERAVGRHEAKPSPPSVTATMPDGSSSESKKPAPLVADRPHE
jgi:hypothetical protein